MREYFPVLYGNAKAKERLGRAIEAKTLAHALLIVGPEGSGKRTLAREISAALNCENKDGGTHTLPCGNCNTCKRIYSGNFTDIKLLEKPKDRATIGVDPIKDIREDMFLSATESDHKIYIVRDAETMTPEAQNALLKVLEEPPTSVTVLLLASEGDKILTTIKSRTQHIAMARFDEKSIEEYLLSKSEDARIMHREAPEKFKAIIMSADGRIGEAEKLMSKKLGEACEEERGSVINIVRSLGRGSGTQNLLSALSELPQKRTELLRILELLINALRDVITSKHSGEARLLFFTSHSDAMARADEIGTAAALWAYDAVCRAHEYCSKNANTQNLISYLAANIKPI